MLLRHLPGSHIQSMGYQELSIKLSMMLTTFWLCLTSVAGEPLNWKNSVLQGDQLPVGFASAGSSPLTSHSSISAESRSKKWYADHKNDPSMGFFYVDSAPSSVPLPRPRSLSNLPSSITSSRQQRDVKSSSSKSSKNKKASKPTKTSNSTTSAVAVSSKQDVEATGRTFLLAPLLAYLLPVFLIQMFGMGMIPAAALILTPVLLLPIGLGAAVFLI